ncbi:MAG: hypothetical protein E7Z93_06365 [Cyanobacteria bacterium SIG32]|nr:hypothetical protein [Cyanobacteria bacterium SIG32]
MIKKVELQSQINETKVCNNKPQTPVQTIEPQQVEKSIYNSKGSNVYFCGMVRGLSYAEEVIADGFREFVANGRRKFNEHDIRDIMDIVKRGKTKEEKEFMLDAVNALLDPVEKNRLDGGSVRIVTEEVDNKAIKKTLLAMEGKSEEARSAILDFADYEIRHSTDPMTSFIQLPKETQDDLTSFLERIQGVRYGNPMRGEDLGLEAGDSLYDLFKVVMYAHEDLQKLNPAERQKYLLEQLDVIGGDIRHWQKTDEIQSPEQRRQIVNLSKDMLYYFTDKFVVS